MSQEEFVPNERLRRARSLKGWSQADLAQHLGTSFETVSRWERGVTVPSFYYRERLCAVLGQTVEELGLTRGHNGSITPSPFPHVFLASSHMDAEKPVVSHLKTYLEERGITLWSSRQLGRQAIENARTTLREVVRATQSILVIVSPEARSSRHVRDALEMARIYQRPVCGVWVEGEHWQDCLPPRMALRRPSRASLILHRKGSHLRTCQRGCTCQRTRQSSQRNSSHHKARLRRYDLHLNTPWNQPMRPNPCLLSCHCPQHRLSLAIERASLASGRVCSLD